LTQGKFECANHPPKFFGVDRRLSWRGFYSEPNGKTSGRIFRQAASQADVFVDFSAFVTVLLSLFWAMFYFAEGMLGVQYGLRDYFQRFRHISLSFLRLTERE
jgi:hypothetical protein